MSNAVRATLAAGMLLATCSPGVAWDFPGHRMVGAIADMVLSKHFKKTHQTVAKLLTIKDLNGNDVTRTLSQVAVFPDCAKPNSEQFCGRQPSQEEKTYVRNNPHHNNYHFTDVPLAQQKYVPFSAGTDEYDVVQMINFIVKQLRAKDDRSKPQLREVSLTDSEAVWLLAHLVGDIHQPLHVGAIYFDKATCGTSVDPNVIPGGMVNAAATNGGNFIELLAVAPAPAVPPADQLHLFWDATAVTTAMQAEGLAGAEQEFARLLAAEAPAGWQPTGDPGTWAQQWAAEMIPLAGEAHAPPKIAITPKPPRISDTGKVTCAWTAKIQPEYSKWAAQRAREQIQKAGFRLAALLTAIFEPQ
jgi:S1/P1 Nuclease